MVDDLSDIVEGLVLSYPVSCRLELAEALQVASTKDPAMWRGGISTWRASLNFSKRSAVLFPSVVLPSIQL
jgi:hypothetical protein